MSYIIGIDPGKNGGAVLLKDLEIIEVYAFKLIGSEFDVKDYYDRLEYWKATYPDITASLEKVHSIYGVSAKSNWTFGFVCGVIEGVLISLDIPYIKVTPKDWQAVLFKNITPIYKPSKKKGRGSLETKKMAAVAFESKYTKFVNVVKVTSKGNLSKNMHDGLVDAALIGVYGFGKK